MIEKSSERLSIIVGSLVLLSFLPVQIASARGGGGGAHGGHASGGGQAKGGEESHERGCFGRGCGGRGYGRGYYGDSDQWQSNYVSGSNGGGQVGSIENYNQAQSQRLVSTPESSFEQTYQWRNSR